MSGLAPNLFDKRFQDLMEIGRARIPSLAPDWTDHNAHDPGITLMELLAWVAEAQLYSLSRMRRDERAAYAALLGFAPTGTVGATGLIWPDRHDLRSPATTYSRTTALSKDTVIQVMGADNPTFRPSDALLWVPGVIQDLVWRQGDGQKVNYTLANERGSVAFLPFGERAGRRDVLSMEYECRDAAGLFGVDRQSTAGARLAIGVLAAPPTGGVAADASGHNFRSPLKATLVINNKREVVSIVSDTTQGLLTTGTILLNLDNIKDSPQRFAIELSAPGGFARPPRIFQIEPNVIPIQQVRQITREPQQPTGMPDWTFTLDEQGLSFVASKEPITLEVSDSSGVARWSRCNSLSQSGPDDLQYELDAETGRVTFGNGINGRIPPLGSQVLVSYAVSDGGAGEVARNRKWTVAGFEGVFGVNPVPVTGGAPAPDGMEQRRMARQRSREEHALVTADDITVDAMALPLLEVARAWLVTPNDQIPQTGVLTLVALRGRQNGAEPAQIPETARWLQAIRRSLTSRMPLGTRLAVVAPRYKDFSILATLEAYPRLAPQAVEEAAMNELRRRFALDGRGQGAKPRQPGVPVTKRDLSAWLRAIDGVQRVVALKLLDAAGNDSPEIAVPRNGLPRWNSSSSKVTVNRTGIGSAR